MKTIGVKRMKKIRVLVAKVGLDGHDRGAKVIAAGLRDAGMEVIYTGIRQTPEDAIGISCLSGAHMTVFSKIVRQLREKGIADILIFGGGIITKNDIPELMKIGVAKIFLPGTRVEDAVSYLREVFHDKKVRRSFGETVQDYQGD
jgi:methylmalonyl-CoA mutase C-terminal domain/subunit